ncbi:MAG TPA: hypothetical protein VFW34_02225 [Candidatus Rubrimentiphilum sp.]|nr:hypothetical protein [Candidatus Rubrimentiphilum sp.]
MVSAIVVNAAAILLESAPFVLAGAICARIPLRFGRRIVPYLGCGCGPGPSARSLPAFAAAWLVFGPAVAAARLGAAIAIEKLAGRKGCDSHDDSMLGEIRAIVPFALGGAALLPLMPAVAGAHLPAAAAGVAAAFAAFVASPCALGTIGIAAIARGIAPAAAAGFLCVAGIFDLRVWSRASEGHAGHDCIAYALAFAACALTAVRSGGGLVNPRFTPALWICAIACAYLAHRYRTNVRPSLRIGPAIMLAGCVLGAPAPVYYATQTTLAGAFPGERIDFTGAVVRVGKETALVRYAIACCRADAAPVSIRLDSSSPVRSSWARARGTLVRRGGDLRLHAAEIRAVTPPADPFVYR